MSQKEYQELMDKLDNFDQTWERPPTEIRCNVKTWDKLRTANNPDDDWSIFYGSSRVFFVLDNRIPGQDFYMRQVMIKINMLKPKWSGRYISGSLTNTSGEKIEYWIFLNSGIFIFIQRKFRKYINWHLGLADMYKKLKPTKAPHQPKTIRNITA